MVKQLKGLQQKGANSIFLNFGKKEKKNSKFGFKYIIFKSLEISVEKCKLMHSLTFFLFFSVTFS